MRRVCRLLFSTVFLEFCILVVVGLLTVACATQKAQQEIGTYQRHLQLNNKAWRAAQVRIIAMCPNKPTREEYEQAKAAGSDPWPGCDARVIKVGNGAQLDDWAVGWLPSYTTIVKVHEEELRKITTLAVYEENIFALSRRLAELTDAGQITPDQLMGAFNSAWTWLGGQMRQQEALLQENLALARFQDAQTWSAIGQIAAGMAQVASASINATAAAHAAQQPLNCYATRNGNYVQVTCR